MALGAALRDRARVVMRTESAIRNPEGGYDLLKPGGVLPMGPVFRCLYDPGNESESRDGGRVRRVRPATLMYARRATDGTVIDLTANDLVEIDSSAHGTIRMEVEGTPTVIPKRRTVIGHLAQLRRVNQ